MKQYILGEFKKEQTVHGEGNVFYPAPFPPFAEFEVDINILDLIEEANHQLGRLDGTANQVPDIDFFVNMYVKKESAQSSNLEGTQATISDVVQDAAGLESERPEDARKVRHYVAAMNYGIDNIDRTEGLPLCMRLIREVHARLLANDEDVENTPGEYRTVQNFIGSRKIETATFVPPTAQEMVPALTDLEKFIKRDALPIRGISPLMRAAFMHAQFETIHPFKDGNGRTGRMMISLYLHEQGRLRHPVFYLSEYLKRNKASYFDSLNEYRRGTITPWLEFFFSGVIEVAKDSIKTAELINEIRQQDEERLEDMQAKTRGSAKIVLKKLYGQPIVDVSIIQDWTGLSKPAAYVFIQKMIEGNILAINKSGSKNRQYAYQRYLDVFD